jgi:hypothetical protein
VPLAAASALHHVTLAAGCVLSRRFSEDAEGVEAISRAVERSDTPGHQYTTFLPNLKGSQPNRCDAFSVETLDDLRPGGVVAAILNHRLMAGIPPG